MEVIVLKLIPKEDVLILIIIIVGIKSLLISVGFLGQHKHAYE
jgi:hypothetical protein